MRHTFDEAEYAGRQARFQDRLRAAGIDVAIVNTPENVCYLSGHETSGYYTYQCLIVPADGTPVLLTRETETVNGRETTYLDDIVGYADADDPLARTVALATARGEGVLHIGMEERSWFLVPAHFNALADALVPHAVTGIDDILGAQRLIKSQAEIEWIRRAAAITNTGLRAAAMTVRPGVSEREVAAVAFAELVRAGSEYLGMEPFVASGPRAGTIHASWSDRVIEAGEGVLLEMSGAKGRYNAPLMHTVRTGALRGETAAMAEACKAAREAAVAAVAPGRTPAEAHAACRAAIEEHGLLHTYRKRSGYSVGLAFAPDWGEGHLLALKETEQRPFEPGMVVHVVPTLRLEGVAGQGFSATVLVTEAGNEILTSCDVESSADV